MTRGRWATRKVISNTQDPKTTDAEGKKKEKKKSKHERETQSGKEPTWGFALPAKKKGGVFSANGQPRQTDRKRNDSHAALFADSLSVFVSPPPPPFIAEDAPSVLCCCCCCC